VEVAVGHEEIEVPTLWREAADYDERTPRHGIDQVCGTPKRLAHSHGVSDASATVRVPTVARDTAGDPSGITRRSMCSGSGSSPRQSSAALVPRVASNSSVVTGT